MVKTAALYHFSFKSYKDFPGAPFFSKMDISSLDNKAIYQYIRQNNEIILKKI
jgi:hypothetical protein